MASKGYVIAQIAEIRDQDSYARYRELTQRTVAKHGGRFVVRDGLPITVDLSTVLERHGAAALRVQHGV